MRGMGYILTVCVTAACVALSLVTGCAVSTDQSATQPIDGLHAQDTLSHFGRIVVQQDDPIPSVLFLVDGESEPDRFTVARAAKIKRGHGFTWSPGTRPLA